MKQSTFMDTAEPPDNDALHVAIIMVGNGRWATARGLPRRAGHRAGADAVRRTVEAAPAHGIGTLTLYAFSSDNWKRPAPEVTHLLRLLHAYLRTETAVCVEQGVRLSVIGRRDRFSTALRRAIEQAEEKTSHGRALHLRIALDYSARDAIMMAASRAGLLPSPTRADFVALLGVAMNARERVTDVDLLIRTGGEQRLSDFMLWECAYAELYFTPCAWPDFDEVRLAAALREYAGRQRRYGGLEVVRTAALRVLP
jgi:undecaprenyl diphosphate synthase